jgi:hypothetical protein
MERMIFMNSAKNSYNGQTAISEEIPINNTSTKAILNAQTAFEGAAEKMDISNEDDVQKLVGEMRKNAPQNVS